MENVEQLPKESTIQEEIGTQNVLSQYDTSFKSFMYYTSITVENSPQWQVQQQATNKDIFRVVNDRYCIAIGTGWGFNVGDKVDVILDNDTTIKCIVGDIKQDIHTDDTNTFTTLPVFNDGKLMVNVVEFILNSTTRQVYYQGDVSAFSEDFKGNVLNIVPA